MEMNYKLTSIEFDSFLGNNKDDRLMDAATSCKRLIGKLLYLSVTKPDISFSVQQLSQFMHKPKQSHMSDAIRIVRYIKNQPRLGLKFPKEFDLQLRAYCDSGWAGCHETRKSIIDICIKMGGSLISWEVKKQKTVSKSSAKFEYRSIITTVSEII